MSQTKVQLVAPVGIVTASGVNVSGTITATSYSGSGENLTGVGVGTTASVNTSGIVTAVSFSGSGENLTNAGIGTTGSINTTGIITAASFYGDGTNLTGITLLGPTNSLNTSGIITAGSFYGDGAGVTNIGGPLDAISYAPAIGSTSVGVTTNIVITFNKPIAGSAATAGIASVTLRTGSASGTVIETFDVATSTALSISGGVLTINPTADLSEGTTYFVVVPTGTFQDTLDTSDNVGITTYSFTTQSFILSLFAWGDGTAGALAQNDAIPRSSPTQIPGTQWNYVDTSHGRNSQLAIKTDGTLWGWGVNTSFGELGLNDTVNRSSPQQIPGTQWNQTEGGNARLATKTDGTLWAWGYNNQGNLGINDRTYRSSPHQIPGTQWNIISAQAGAAATKTDGTLWTWGSNYFGQLGINIPGGSNYRSSPVQVPGTQWNKIQAVAGMRATKTDGTLWSWGYNSQGQMGQNNKVRYSSPTQIPGTQWNSLSASSLTTLTTKTDGTLWAWGRNTEGQLGQNSTVYYSSPVQIPGTEWDKLASSNYGFFATKTDGTLWGWGNNYSGQLGQNSRPQQYSSPRQIPGTQWTNISSNHNTIIAIQRVPQ